MTKEQLEKELSALEISIKKNNAHHALTVKTFTGGTDT